MVLSTAVFLYRYKCCDCSPPVPPLGQYYQEFWQATPAELHFLKLNIRTCTAQCSNDSSTCQETELQLIEPSASFQLHCREVRKYHWIMHKLSMQTPELYIQELHYKQNFGAEHQTVAILPCSPYFSNTIYGIAFVWFISLIKLLLWQKRTNYSKNSLILLIKNQRTVLVSFLFFFTLVLILKNTEMSCMLLNPFDFYSDNGWMQKMSEDITEDLWVILKFVISSDKLIQMYTSLLHGTIFAKCMNMTCYCDWKDEKHRENYPGAWNFKSLCSYNQVAEQKIHISIKKELQINVWMENMDPDKERTKNRVI